MIFFWQLLYTIFGTRQVVVPDYSYLQNRLELYIDGVKITSIPDVESIVVVNIPSWAAGVKLWNQTSKLKIVSTNDFCPYCRQLITKIEIISWNTRHHCSLK